MKTLRLHNRSILVFFAVNVFILLGLGASSTVFAQCTASAGFQCVPQADADRIAQDLKELKNARDVIAKFQAERTATDAERQAATVLLKAANDALDTLAKGIADREKLIELQSKTLQLYSDLVSKLTTQINQPKSAFSRFMTALKELAYLAAGIALGRHL